MQILIKNLQNKVPLYPLRIKRLIFNILKGERVTESGCINICFVNNTLIKKFNIQYLKNTSSTDVLAFNLSDRKNNKILLADIMISAETAITHARKFKTTPNYELMLYVAHGILHILGYDDRNNTEAKLMRKKEAVYVDR
ncbi:MAG: rRNA maturation RNase YbeY [Candidatus Omnitrophica bacterium]|nr:rRNA maturation RNase YbeY [Candidatus Omnitrophota bacterium]